MPKRAVRNKPDDGLTEFDKLVRANAEKEQNLLNSEWVLGFMDRGLGHGDYAVILKTNEVVVPCNSRAIAEHLIEIHNHALALSKVFK